MGKLPSLLDAVRAVTRLSLSGRPTTPKRIAVVGDRGAGKSTSLATMLSAWLGSPDLQASIGAGLPRPAGPIRPAPSFDNAAEGVEDDVVGLGSSDNGSDGVGVGDGDGDSETEGEGETEGRKSS